MGSADGGLGVFVFKQKTAYEMRISDWSSDVCSSDLGGVGDHLVRGEQRDRAAADRIPDSPLRRAAAVRVGHVRVRDGFAAVRPGQLDGDAGGGTRAAGLRGRPDVTGGAGADDLDLPAGQARAGNRAAGDGDGGRAGRRPDPRRVDRSEEHTSELQSLMRISYAVFCLTKKSITTRNE